MWEQIVEVPQPKNWERLGEPDSPCGRKTMENHQRWIKALSHTVRAQQLVWTRCELSPCSVWLALGVQKPQGWEKGWSYPRVGHKIRTGMGRVTPRPQAPPVRLKRNQTCYILKELCRALEKACCRAWRSVPCGCLNPTSILQQLCLPPHDHLLWKLQVLSPRSSFTFFFFFKSMVIFILLTKIQNSQWPRKLKSELT